MDGRDEEVEVDLIAGTARLGLVTYPIKVVSGESDRVELEIDGERVGVEGWLVGLSAPPGEGVAVNGERVKAQLIARDAFGAPSLLPRSTPTRATPPPVGVAPTTSGGLPPETGPGVVIVPPMPGKVIELRAKAGDVVRAGQVVLVLEAMKMRNEVTSPIAGQVSEVHVAVGANVRAKEPMLRIVPG